MTNAGPRPARRCAVQALYQWRATGQPQSRIETDIIDHSKLRGTQRAYFLSLIEAIPSHIEEIDALIAPHLDRKPERVDWVAEAILRLGAYELRYARDIPTKVVLNEAVELARLYGPEHGYKYVNGVLDKIAHAVRDEIANGKTE